MPPKMPHLHPTNRVLKRSFLAFLLSSLGFWVAALTSFRPVAPKLARLAVSYAILAGSSLAGTYPLITKERCAPARYPKERQAIQSK